MTWRDVGNLRGEMGATGPQGATGETGPTEALLQSNLTLKIPITLNYISEEILNSHS